MAAKLISRACPAAWGVALGLVGCTGASPPPATEWSERGEPLTVIELSDQTSWPFEVATVEVWLDGQRVYRDGAHEPGLVVPIVALASLPHGEHSLVARARARYVSTRIDGRDGCVAGIRASRPFYVADAPVGIRLELRSDDVTQRFAERFEMHISVTGNAFDEHGYDVDAGVFEREPAAPLDVCRDDAPLPFDEADTAVGPPLHGRFD